MIDKDFDWVGPLNRPFYIKHLASSPQTSMATDKKLFKLHFLLSGDFDFKIRGHEVSCKAPLILCEGHDQGLEFKSMDGIIKTIFFHPGEVHEVFFDRDPSDNRGFEGGAMMDQFYLHPFFLFNDEGFSRISLDLDGLNRVHYQLELLSLEMDAKSFYWPCRSRSYFLELLMLVRKLYDLGASQSLQNNLLVYIHTHYHESLTIDRLTEHFATNRTGLIQKFKAATGKSLGEYIRHFRLTLASSLLRDTTLPLQEIIERVGYVDISHFTRAFKEQFGQTPAAYRKSINWVLPHFR